MENRLPRRHAQTEERVEQKKIEMRIPELLKRWNLGFRETEAAYEDLCCTGDDIPDSTHDENTGSDVGNGA